mmetsp:Transcript_104845/g.254472  ORF Transcript_104845/g.254472 Transcript_104845/m.254472 type:complete len:300 (+) Transcript_104845:981-1880(+)
MDTELEALPKLLIELLVVILLLSNLSKHLQALLDQVLLDDTQDLVLLQRLSGNVQGQVLRVHDALDHVEPLRHQFITVIHDEDTAHVQLNVVPLLLGLKKIKWCPAWHKEQSPELKLSFNAEVLDSQMILPIVGEGLVEGGVLLISHILRLAHPQWLVLVQLLPLMRNLLDLLGLLLLGLLFLLLINLLNLWLIALLALLFLLLLLVLRISHLLLFRLFHVKLNGETDELGVFLHQILQTALLQKFRLILLQVADHLCTPLDFAMDKFGVFLHRERTASTRLPNVLLVIVVLTHHTDFV